MRSRLLLNERFSAKPMLVKALLFILAGSFVLSAAPLRGQDRPEDEQRALEILRQTVNHREQKNLELGRIENQIPPEAFTNGQIFAVMERRYLDGKITAKQFQRFLRETPVPVIRDPAIADTPEQEKALEVLRGQSSESPPGNPPPPVPQAPVSQPEVIATETPASPDQIDLSELEVRMDELLILKKARERAAETNLLIDPTDPQLKMTRRDRLNQLLRQYIQGKLTEAQYEEKRVKVLALPE